MDKSCLAAQLYTLREHLKTPEDIYSTLKRVKDIGYTSVQVSGMGPIEPEKLKSYIDELGLTICVTHIPFQRFIEGLDDVIKDHKLWGCKYVGLRAMPVDFRGSAEGYREFLKQLDTPMRKLHENGLKFAYHNHKFEFECFNGTTGMDILFNETSPELFDFIIDTYWIQAGGASPVDWIHKVKGRMGVVHFKDMAIVKDQQVFAEVGNGNIDWKSVIKACDETGVKWCAVEQDVCPVNPFDSLSISYNNLMNLI